MSIEASHDATHGTRVLSAYLLGRLDFDDLLALQRRLVYDVSGNPSQGILLFCEHSLGISIGRQGSAADVRLENDELRNHGWPVRWVNRGAGSLLSSPGQIAIYPIVAIDQHGLNVQQYLEQLHEVLRTVMASFDLAAVVHPDRPGVWIGDRLIAHVGVAVRGGITSFGATINVDPDLKPFRHVRCDGDAHPMTSMLRECRVRSRPATVRQRFLEEFANRFGFARTSLFHHHPALPVKASRHAVVTPAR